MGLDMHLHRMPRCNEATVQDVLNIENYLDYLNRCKDPDSSVKNYTLKEWCGIDEKDVPSGGVFEFYQHFYNTKYPYWDDKHEYGEDRIVEEIGYWRKANQIHNWFVDNVQDGEDDCDYHKEVAKETLEDLLDICQQVLASCELIDGQINNGYKFEDGKQVPIVVDGKYVKDPGVAMELLPTRSGFFFGGTDYDEYYVDDIKKTIDIITKALKTTDFETEMIYYVSSW